MTTDSNNRLTHTIELNKYYVGIDGVKVKLTADSYDAMINFIGEVKNNED